MNEKKDICKLGPRGQFAGNCSRMSRAIACGTDASGKNLNGGKGPIATIEVPHWKKPEGAPDGLYDVTQYLLLTGEGGENVHPMMYCPFCGGKLSPVLEAVKDG